MTDGSRADGDRTRTRVFIIGAGFGGIGLGIKLKAAGLHDFVIADKAGCVGGVWAKNRYPGAACDVPSHLYSFSFEPRPDWSRRYATQPEILDYLTHCVNKYGLAPHIRLGTEVTEARWDEAAAHWTVRTADGQLFEAQALVAATGQLSRPSYPPVPGLASFAGAVFHSAEWRTDYDVRGKRVAVVGTGASAIQIVPAIAPLVDKLYVFQRSAAYVLPKADGPYSRWQILLFKHVPGALKLSRMLIYLGHEWKAFAFVSFPAALRLKRRSFIRHLERGVGDVSLRRRLIPDYRIGCKRILLSNDFFPAMGRANVELVTQGIAEIRPHAILTADGGARDVDCIVLATGFAATDFLAPIKVVGLGARDLHESWKDGAEAYLGMAVAGFPNFFMLYGPNTNLAHNSIVYMLEGQIRYVMACLRRLRGDGIRSIEVKRSKQESFNARIQKRLQASVWAMGCTSWYLTPARKNTTNWPGYSFVFRLKTGAPDWNDYVCR